MKHVFFLIASFVAAVHVGSTCLRVAAQAVTTSTRPTKNFFANPTDDKGRQIFLRGQTATNLPNRRIGIGGLTLQLERNGIIDTTIQAPRAIYDQNEGAVFSDGEFTLQTADGRLALQGRGYHWSVKESRLILSNAVQTTVRKRAAKAAVSPNTPRTTVSASTNQEFITILSDQLDYRSELALFMGNVRATDSDSRFSSGKLAIYFASGSTNRLDRIEAEQNVLLEQGSLWAKADHALYNLEQDKNLVALKGNAAWREGRREGSAENLTLDRAQNILRAEGRAQAKLPRESLAQSSMLFPVMMAATNSRPGTNQFIEIKSELLVAKLSPTNGPIQRLEAERNVVIVNTGDGTRASGQKAVYDDVLGAIELTGQPVIEMDNRIVKGDRLAFDRVRNLFTARGNAYLKMPVSALGRSAMFTNAAAGAKAIASTNSYLEFFADEIEYRTNQLDFQRSVRAHWLEGEMKRGQLLTAVLQVKFGEKLESLTANGGVEGLIFPAARSDGKKVTSQFRAQTLTAKMNASGQLDVAVLEGGVQAEQTTVRTNKPAPSLTKLAAEILTAKFGQTTNRVDNIVAERNVVIERDGRIGRSARAVFDGVKQILELTGQPAAQFPEGRLEGADALTWDATKQEWRARGRYQLEGRMPATTNKTNALNLPR